MRLCNTCGYPERYHGKTIKRFDDKLVRLPPTQRLANLTKRDTNLICSEYEHTYDVMGVL